jgi:hypothetical protein
LVSFLRHDYKSWIIVADANETLNKLISQLSSAANANTSSTIDLASILQSSLVQSLTSAFTSALNGAPTSTTTPANDKVPEYRPTPLVELERRRREGEPSLVKPDASECQVDETARKRFSPPTFA